MVSIMFTLMWRPPKICGGSWQEYCIEDAGTKKFVVAKFLDYKMIDSQPVIDQVEELQLIVHDVHAEGMVLPDAFTGASMIEKLPPCWKDFNSYLKHERK